MRRKVIKPPNESGGISSKSDRAKSKKVLDSPEFSHEHEKNRILMTPATSKQWQLMDRKWSKGVAIKDSQSNLLTLRLLTLYWDESTRLRSARKHWFVLVHTEASLWGIGLVG